MWAFGWGEGETRQPEEKILTTSSLPADEVSQIVKKLSPWFVNSILSQEYYTYLLFFGQDLATYSIFQQCKKKWK